MISKAISRLVSRVSYMGKKGVVALCFLVLLWASMASSQSDSACPANTAMGLCADVNKPCVDDSDCFSGEICCPQACSRTCKSRHTRQSRVDSSVPDLLNDPRVYVGKCPDASCFSLFGGDGDECSTSRLCPDTQFCCNDGCRNVCHWKPEYAALIAKEQARARHRQQLIIQKQQQEMRRRQREMHLQRQRQLAAAEQARRKAEAERARKKAEAEQARKRAEARAAAEAELAVQMQLNRAQMEADLKVISSPGISNPQQQHVGAPSSQPDLATGSFLDNFKSDPQTASAASTGKISLAQKPVQGQDVHTQKDASIGQGHSPTNKKDNAAGTDINQIHSPASVNPYSRTSQQNGLPKSAKDEFMSIIHSPPSTSINQDLARNNHAAIGFPPKTDHLSYVTKQSVNIGPVQTVYQSPAHKPSFAYSPQQVPASILPPAYHGQPAPKASLRGASSVRQFQNNSVTYLSQKLSQIYPTNRIYQSYPIQKVYAPNADQQLPSAYSAQKQRPTFRARLAVPSYAASTYQRLPQSNFPYQVVGRYGASLASRQQRRSDSMTPFLMYQMMQAA